MTLYLHEVHQVAGSSADEFEAAYRDPGGWMDLLGRADDARLLYFLNQAHGSGPSYRVITITAVADGAAWERLARDVQFGELSAWAARTDQLRHESVSKLLLPVAWSPLGDLDLAAVPAAAADHEPTLFMEDTGWPSSSLDDYVRFWGDEYHPLLARRATGHPTPRDPGLLGPGPRHRPSTGGHPLAAHPQPRPAGRAAQHRGGPRAKGGRHLHGQCPRVSRPVGVPSAAHRRLVAALPDGAGIA